MVNHRWIYWLPKPIRNKLSGRINLQIILANSGWLIAEKIIRMLLGLFIGTWIARYLGPNQYGEIAYALAYIAFFQAITSLGIDGIVIREISCDKTNAAQILGTSLILRLGVGFTCWLTAIFGMAWIHGWNNQTVWIVAIAGSCLIFQAADTIDLWFQSQSKNHLTVTVKLCTYISASIIKIILLITQASLMSFVIVMAFEALLYAIGLIFIYKKFPCSSNWGFISPLAVRIIYESWPFMLSSLAIMVYMRIDQIMIKEFLNEKELGIYAAVLPLSTTWQIIPMTLCASFAPFLAARKNQNENDYLLMLRIIFRTFSLVGWVICIPIWLFSDVIVSALLGDQYKEAGEILSIHIFTNMFIGLGIAQSLWAINEKKSEIFLYKVIIGALVCLIGNLLFLPTIGIKASAFTAVLSQLFAAVLSNIIWAPNIFLMQIKSIFFLKK